MRLRPRPAIAVGMSLAASTLGLVFVVPGAYAATSVGVPCHTAALVKAIDDANATPTTLDGASRCTSRLTAIDDHARAHPREAREHGRASGRAPSPAHRARPSSNWPTSARCNTAHSTRPEPVDRGLQ
jgi:hypothetical protein